MFSKTQAAVMKAIQMKEATALVKDKDSSVCFHHVFMICFIVIGLLAGFRHVNYKFSHRIVFGRWPQENKDNTDTRNNRDGIAADAATNNHHKHFPSKKVFASDLVPLPPPSTVTFDLAIWKPQGLWTVFSYSTHIGIMSIYLRQLPQPEEKLKAIAVGNLVGLAITVCCDLMAMWIFLLVWNSISKAYADQWRRKFCSCQHLGDIHGKAQAKGPDGGK